MEHLIFYWTPLHINMYILFYFLIYSRFHHCCKNIGTFVSNAFFLYILGKFLNRDLRSLFGRHGAQTSNA